MAHLVWDLDEGWMAYQRAISPSYDRAIRETLRLEGHHSDWDGETTLNPGRRIVEREHLWDPQKTLEESHDEDQGNGGYPNRQPEEERHSCDPPETIRYLRVETIRIPANDHEYHYTGGSEEPEDTY